SRVSVFFSLCLRPPRPTPFPTRRSSDLRLPAAPGGGLAHRRARRGGRGLDGGPGGRGGGLHGHRHRCADAADDGGLSAAVSTAEGAGTRFPPPPHRGRPVQRARRTAGARCAYFPAACGKVCGQTPAGLWRKPWITPVSCGNAISASVWTTARK